MLSSLVEMTYKPSSNLPKEAERQWREIIDRRPDLEPAVELQRRIVNRSLALAAVVDEQTPVTVGLGPTEVAAKLRQQLPILAGETIQLDAGAITPFVVGFCEDLASGETGGAGGRLGDMLGRGTIDMGSLLAASLGRQQEAIRTKAHHVGVSPDLLWLVAELASGPLAHHLQRQLLTELPRENEALRLAIGEWKQGFCAACGSWPAFGERIGDTERRSLRCSFCGSAWAPAPGKCIYCDEGGDSLIAAAVEPDQPSRLLELCRQCGAYLKCIDVRRPTPFQLLPVEDLSTWHLDFGAVQQGYVRPPMRVFATGDTLPCPPPASAPGAIYSEDK